jgi:DNA-directed RNA polymerase subunit M/transcription elongation factor TFIIS
MSVADATTTVSTYRCENCRRTWNEVLAANADDGQSDDETCGFCGRRGHVVLAQIIRDTRLVQQSTCTACGHSWESGSSSERTERV